MLGLAPISVFIFSTSKWTLEGQYLQEGNGDWQEAGIQRSRAIRGSDELQWKDCSGKNCINWFDLQLRPSELQH
jgi:hypothetical protein